MHHISCTDNPQITQIEIKGSQATLRSSQTLRVFCSV
jgi:hypothetical protein